MSRQPISPTRTTTGIVTTTTPRMRLVSAPSPGFWISQPHKGQGPVRLCERKGHPFVGNLR
nr:MAG TPA: IL-36Ra, chimera protein, interleukin.55A [Caudoviricetes sp.]